MSSEASTAGADQDSAHMVEELKRELSEAHRREAATAKVFKAISRSASELQPALETLVRTAARMCAADQGFIFRLESDLYHLAVDYATCQEFREFMDRHPMHAGRGTLVWYRRGRTQDHRSRRRYFSRSGIRLGQIAKVRRLSDRTWGADAQRRLGAPSSALRNLCVSFVTRVHREGRGIDHSRH
jgi:hypothetical protein